LNQSIHTAHQTIKNGLVKTKCFTLKNDGVIFRINSLIYVLTLLCPGAAATSQLNRERGASKPK